MTASLSMLFLTTACQQQPGSKSAQSTRSVAGEDRAEHRISLVERGSWQMLNSDGPYLVSPRFSPQGKRLLASGLRGRGLFLLHRTGRMEVVSPHYRGPARFMADGKSICADFGEDGRPAVVSLVHGRAVGARADGCDEPVFDEIAGRVIYEDQKRRITHNALRGDLVVEESNAGPVLVEDGAPWSIRVTSDGGRIAYTVGGLDSPSLYVYDSVSGRRLVGRGVHAAWFPDGRHLVYSVPGPVVRLPGHTTVYSADLHVFNAETGASWKLTDTRDLAEMQPAVAPDGSAVAFSDWHYGGLYVAPLAERRQP